jgi:hypothetical protein
VSLIVGSAPVHAQPAPPAPDGQLFQNQSQATQADFTATFGSSCAAREWVWQHSLAVDADDMLAGPPASDGQALVGQDDDIQLMFVALFGPAANAEWVAERNAVLAHKVLLGTVAPIPCPPSKNSRPQDVIGTTHLSEAVESARDGKLNDAVGNFIAFATIWKTSQAEVTRRAPAQAQAVQTAFDQANALLGDPKAPAPAQSQYYPALQALLRAVRTANAAAAGGGGGGGETPTPAAPAAATAPAAPATTAPLIPVVDLGEAVESASKSDLVKARKDFGEFDDDWEKLGDAIKAAAPTLYASLDDAVDGVNDLLNDPARAPAQSQYYPALQNLLKAVQTANTTLGH